MSLEHQLPVLIKKAQMNGEQSQCGLTSLLPMSCRGRAEAFARRLHTRLRNLGNSQDSSESSWLAAHENNNTANHDSDLFFNFELECESPSSPIDDCDPPFLDRSPSDDVPFYDVESVPEQNGLNKQSQENGRTPINGFNFTNALLSDRSPIKSQPTPRETGRKDGRISAINLEDCAKHDCFEYEIDEPDCVPTFSQSADQSRIPFPHQSLDSDSDFESAKSDPSITLEDDHNKDTIELLAQQSENLSLCEEELPKDESCPNLTSVPAIEGLEIVNGCVSPEEEKSLIPIENALKIQIDNDEKQEADSAEDEKPERLRRCSSLKTGKTPPGTPGTPGRKKIVRFADVLGLDLADVKTFLDEIPIIPKSAYNDLAGAELAACSPPVQSVPKLSTLTLVPLFQLPSETTEALQSNCVCLEAARVMEGVHITICGSVRVRNLDFHKTVHIRYSINGWRTFTDLQATYVQGSCDGFSDRFQFVLYAPCISVGQRLEIAVRFQCKGCQYWDNNSGLNYKFDCLPLGAAPSATCSSSTMSSGPLHPTRDWHPSFY